MITTQIYRGKEETHLWCDKCGGGYKWDEIVAKTRVYAIGRREGWSMGKLHVCKSCRGGVKNETRGSD